MPPMAAGVAVGGRLLVKSAGEAERFTASRPTPENGRMALISPSPPEMWKGVPGSGWKDPRQAGCQNRGGSVNEC